VGQSFLKHEVMLNEVFLGLVTQDGKTPAKVPRGFRWILGEYLDLRFNEVAADARGIESRRLQPDAVLEDPTRERRTSSNTRPAVRPSAMRSSPPRPWPSSIDTAPSSERQQATCSRASARRSYTRGFKDGWPREVLFVTPSEARRDTIAGVIAARENTVTSTSLPPAR
jgi:hypothetical protein